MERRIYSLGANSFLLEYTPIYKEHKNILAELSLLQVYPFALRERDNLQ